MDVTLRHVTPDDETFLYELYKWAHSAELPADHMDANQREFLFRMQFYAQQQTYGAQFPKAEDKIILVNGRPAGRLLVEQREDEIRGVDIALLPEHQSTGVGTLLIQDLMAEAGRAGKPFRIQVVKTNRAARLYERLGLYKTGESGAHYAMEWLPDK
ncbi:MAG TPA: GNAT family N-acetyltransferase [Blastocatellia bacterium]|jgi:ribosomal protein S18 acetylase RimI-like enzyme